MPISKGMRRRDTISPILFTSGLQEVVTTLDWVQKGVRVKGESFSNLRFADDVALLISTSGDELQNMVTELERQSRMVALNINVEKINVQ